MRYLSRLEKPQKLVDNEEEWTQKFINSGKDRPSSNQYDHIEIKEALANLSFHKCFYSEVKFAQVTEAQIDHYVEIAEDKTKTFSWENLYLSHKDSNMGKPSNKVLPNVNCLCPFIDSDIEIEQNLDFDDEIICGLTEKGVKTIQKYKLDKPIYNTLRANELKKFTNIIYEIALHGKILDEELKNTLKAFANRDKPFSLMFKKILIKHGLI